MSFAILNGEWKTEVECRLHTYGIHISDTIIGYEYKYKIGPNTEPYVTPCITVYDLEKQESTVTICFSLVK